MSPLARLVAGLVRAYQLVVSPWITQQCKYYPSCSAYALEAIRTKGALRGTRLAVWRLLRCNPWSRGGVDHVPGHVSTTTDAESNSAESSSAELVLVGSDSSTQPFVAPHVHARLTQPART